MKIIQNCPVCASTDHSKAFAAPTTRGQDKRLWSVDECYTCGHQFMNPQPSWGELQTYYNDSYDPYDPTHGSEVEDAEEIAKAKQSGKFRHIPLPTGKRLLDVGCGAGFFLRIAKKLGAVGQGVEPSKYAASVAQAQGLNVYNGTLEDFAAQTDAKFDVITSNHVIEHVPNPIETLACMKSLLAPGGFVWISVPNAAYPLSKALKGRWHSSDLPYHLMHFSPKSMAMTGEAAGLKVRHQTTDSMPSAVAASLTQYLRHKWLLPGRFTAKSEVVLPKISRWYARRMDGKKNGEAIITEFV